MATQKLIKLQTAYKSAEFAYNVIHIAEQAACEKVGEDRIARRAIREQYTEAIMKAGDARDAAADALLTYVHEYMVGKYPEKRESLDTAFNASINWNDAITLKARREMIDAASRLG